MNRVCMEDKCRNKRVQWNPFTADTIGNCPDFRGVPLISSTRKCREVSILISGVSTVRGSTVV